MATAPDMDECIRNCTDCHRMCLHEALDTSTGKPHSPELTRLLLNCADICQTSARFMISGSTHHIQTCAVCASLCEACAEACASVAGMHECEEMCRRCATSCHGMSAVGSANPDSG